MRRRSRGWASPFSPLSPIPNHSRRISAMKNVIHKANQVLAGFCGWLMVTMMILLVMDVVSRVIGRPLQGMAEMSVFVMMVVIYLGLARCEEHKEHVSLELLGNALPPRRKKILDAVNRLLAVLTVAIFAYTIIQNAIFSFVNNESLEGTVELRIWPTKFIIAGGVLFFLLQTVMNFADALRGKEPGISGRDLF